MSKRKQTGKRGKKGKTAFKPISFSEEVILAEVEDFHVGQECAAEIVKTSVTAALQMIFRRLVHNQAARELTRLGAAACSQADTLVALKHDAGEFDWTRPLPVVKAQEEEEEEEEEEKKEGTTEEATEGAVEEPAPLGTAWCHIPAPVEAPREPTWTCEAEPRSKVVERWAEGVVPVKKRMKGVQGSFKFLSNVKSVGGFKQGPKSVYISNKWEAGSTRSHKSRISLGYRRTPRSGNNLSVGEWKAPHSRQATVSEEPNFVPQSIAPHKRFQEAEVVAGLRRRQVRRIEKEARAERWREEAQERKLQEQKQAAQLKQELKGKKYTVDEHGKLIVIRTLHADKLPAPAVTPTMAVRDQVKEETQEPQKRGQRKKTQSRKTVRRPKAKVVSVPVQAEAVLVDRATVQPPLTSHIKLAPGVTVRDKASGTVKNQPRTAQGVRAMNRAEFRELLKKQQTEEPRRVPPPTLPPKSDAPSTVVSLTAAAAPTKASRRAAPAPVEPKKVAVMVLPARGTQRVVGIGGVSPRTRSSPHAGTQRRMPSIHAQARLLSGGVLLNELQDQPSSPKSPQHYRSASGEHALSRSTLLALEEDAFPEPLKPKRRRARR